MTSTLSSTPERPSARLLAPSGDVAPSEIKVAAEPSPALSRLDVRPVTHADLPAIDALNADAFGPGRFTRTAYRLREGTPDISPYCRALWRIGAAGDRELVAAVRMTQIAVGEVSGVLWLGPLVVRPTEKNKGHGLRLLEATANAAADAGCKAILLVGDAAYYARAGYRPILPGQVVLPGPVDPARLLVRELEGGVADHLSGAVRTT